jgi:hypothetical protein
MIKALFLIFEPQGTWERIALAHKSVSRVLFLFLIPTILLSVGGELAGMAHWGHRQSFGEPVKIPQDKLLMYGAVEVLLYFAVVFIAAKIIKSVTGTFQPRHTFTSAFALVSYGLSPLFLFHLLDAYPAISPWISFPIGIVLSVATLYSGVPRMLEPDPPNAFGVFLTSAFLLVGMTGVARLASLLFLTGPMNQFNSLG